MASAKGATVETPEAPEGGVYGGSVPLSNGGEVWGEGCAPPQIFFFDFRAQNGEISCILAAILAARFTRKSMVHGTILHVLQS